jgi:hypothetical protein
MQTALLLALVACCTLIGWTLGYHFRDRRATTWEIEMDWDDESEEQVLPPPNGLINENEELILMTVIPKPDPENLN